MIGKSYIQGYPGVVSCRFSIARKTVSMGALQNKLTTNLLTTDHGRLAFLQLLANFFNRLRIVHWRSS